MIKLTIYEGASELNTSEIATVDPKSDPEA
jgi:hypothetical protein